MAKSVLVTETTPPPVLPLTDENISFSVNDDISEYLMYWGQIIYYKIYHPGESYSTACIWSVVCTYDVFLLMVPWRMSLIGIQPYFLIIRIIPPNIIHLVVQVIPVKSKLNNYRYNSAPIQSFPRTILFAKWCRRKATHWRTRSLWSSSQLDIAIYYRTINYPYIRQGYLQLILVSVMSTKFWKIKIIFFRDARSRACGKLSFRNNGSSSYLVSIVASTRCKGRVRNLPHNFEWRRFDEWKTVGSHEPLKNAHH